MGLTTRATWARVLRYSILPALVTAAVGLLDHLLLPYRIRRR